LPQGQRQGKPGQPGQPAQRSRGERSDEKILADPNAYLNAAPFPGRSGGGGRGGYGGARGGKPAAAGQGQGQGQGQRGSGERSYGNRGPRQEDTGVRSNLPPGWGSNSGGRR
jgi:hypothetical protein